MFAEDVLIPILAIVGFFTSIIVFTYMFFSYRSRIRLALIEQDKNAGIFRVSRDKTRDLRNGSVAVLSGIGILVGYLLEQAGVPEFVAYLSMILIFGGIGLVGYYYFVGQRSTGEEIV